MQKMIFIVDDNAGSVTIAENILSKQYRTIALSSAAGMFEALEKFSPDLILLDVKMPEMDGFEALKILKSRKEYAEIPVMFLTSLSDTGSEAYGIELGATDFVMKPFSEPVLLNRIRNHLQTDELKNRIRSMFKQYTDPKLVDRLIEDGADDDANLGESRHVAVLFVDVRSFTPMVENLQSTPETVVRILNEYLELTSCAVYVNGGSVDKFIGDATMALFNGFSPLDDYVYRAVKTAWDMVCGASAMNASLKERFGIDIGFGIGVHCGPVIVGNIGSSLRKDFTAIGDTVNTASRLESHAKASQVLLSREVIKALGDRIESESIGNVILKGKSEAIEVFSLLSVNE